MIVTRSNFLDVLVHLQTCSELALDTETTGLRPYHGDEFFSLIICDGKTSYYFNFNEYPEIGEEENLEHPEFRRLLGLFFASDSGRLWFLHNAKFDLAILHRAGWTLEGRIHDTMAVARLCDSSLFPNQFSLDECGKRIGFPKDDAVKTWLLKSKAWREEPVPGKKTKTKNLLYTLAPWDLIVPYGERDAALTFRLAKHQQKELTEISQQLAAARSPGSTLELYHTECDLTRTVFEMEARGVLIDRDFCKRAIASLANKIDNLEAEFAALAGEPYLESTKVFQRLFKDEEWVYGDTTATGKRNPSFDSDVLAGFKHPAAKLVLHHRKAKSDSDYFHGFLHAADPQGVIHTSFNQHGTTTGRFSSSGPNLQNLTKDEDDAALAAEFVVRRAIVPRPGMVFHMLDYDQMEYRLMLDYAARAAVDKDGVLALIAKVLEGLDVHQATADGAGCTRREAKTVNFAVLYGSGIANLAGRLGVTESRAREIRDSVFRAAPEIRYFIRRATDAAEKRGFIVNWCGRRYSFPDAAFAYRAPNYIIQGGCADTVKLAMNKIRCYLTGPIKTRLVLMIHDELVLEGPPEEAAEVVPTVKKIMETVFPSRFLPLTCGIDHSYKSLADKVEGIAQCVKS